MYHPTVSLSNSLSLSHCSHDAIIGWFFFDGSQAVINCWRSKLLLNTVKEKENKKLWDLFVLDDVIITVLSATEIPISQTKLHHQVDLIVEAKTKLSPDNSSNNHLI